MKTPDWWQSKGIKAQLLRPVSMFWRLGAAIRAAKNKPEKLDVPVWCVGNVTAGGGGKTPFCLYLGRQVKQAGINAYFVSRGYGGSCSGPEIVDLEKHSYEDVGDEALLLAQCLPTVVAHERLEAAKFAAEQGAELIIMDDGMQYPHLHKDKTFLMLKGKDPLGNGYMMPAGPLREPLAGALKRSDVVVRVDGIPSLNSNQPVWEATTHITLPKLENNQLIAFAGIAHPHHFRKQLQSLGLNIIEFHAFADHHAYSKKDLQKLIDRAQKENATLITTAKDAVRIPPEYRDKEYVDWIVVAKQSLELAQAHELGRAVQELTASPR